MLELFLAFFKIGGFSFGGGYAMISLLQLEAVNRGWLTAQEFTEIVAISQITPGPLAVNMATFVGYRQIGIPGSIAATAGVSLPSLIFVLIAVRFVSRFNSSKLLESIFFGLRPAVTGLIFAAALQIAWGEFFPGSQTMDFVTGLPLANLPIIVLSIVAGFALIKFKLSPIVVILASAAVGVFL